MTKTYFVPNTNWAALNSFFVGFDHVFSEASKFHDDFAKNVHHYPPYDIKKIDENHYSIEIAVAGFSRSELDIEYEENKLVVTGKCDHDHTNGGTTPYIHKGISTRAFTRTFSLNESIVIKDAKLTNGILQILLERIIPDHKKSRKINISDPSSKEQNTKEFLTETKDV